MSIEIQIPKDLKKIDVNNLGELIWWTNHLGICPEKILSIIEKVGNSIVEIRGYTWFENNRLKFRK